LEEAMSNTTDYVLGHSDFEIARLKVQAAALADITRRLIRECGIQPGMRVLDIGCGAGDVSILLAEAVGPSGLVVAMDREARAVETARSRAEAAGYGNIEVLLATDDDMPAARRFDAALGRYVLPHQRDAVAMIRGAASAVRPRGVVAFHECPAIYPPKNQALPSVTLYEEVVSATTAALLATEPSPDVACRLVACFVEAGLPSPHLFCECLIGDSTSLIPRWWALTYRSMLPHIVRLGLEPNSVGDPETLVERLEAELTTVRAQVVSNPQICAWAVRP
jgi:cyclopropane fatty-acyl-phospholipid synthase-like methyltransferase